MKKIKVEICCGSYDDVLISKASGTDRVELNSAIFLGGLTPSIGQLILSKKTGIEIMAMVRPREGGFCYTHAEFETMLTDISLLLSHGADGIVFGVLNRDGTVDVKRCECIMKIIGDKTSVFHRAIDIVPDWRSALDTLISLGVTRVLTSGQEPSVHYGAHTVREMIDYVGGRIEILPGGGVNQSNIQEIIRLTGCDQVHASLRKNLTDTSTANTSIHFGGALYPREDIFQTTDGSKVTALIDSINSNLAEQE